MSVDQGKDIGPDRLTIRRWRGSSNGPRRRPESGDLAGIRRRQEFPNLEASSLSKHSYPIDVAWFSKAGACNHACQADIWLDGLVDATGTDVLPVEHVAQGALSALAGKRAVRQRSILEWQEAETLPRTVAHPRHALRFAKFDEAFIAAEIAILRPHLEGTHAA